jgi:4a-hydroxytetrahydrobiopterin dehydratase
MSTLEQKSCLPCEGFGKSLDNHSAKQLMTQLAPGWQISADNQAIQKDFEFKNYYQTMAFVNAIAWMAHHENHHPDLEVSYNHCLVRYSTHALGGLSENDFICAKKVDGIIGAYEQKKRS